MEQKVKFIIIGLIGILIISVFLSFQIYVSKQAVEREKENLITENAGLRKQMDETIQNARRLEDRVRSLNDQVDSLGRERDELQKRYDLANKTKEELAEQLEILKSKAKSVRVESAQPQVQALAPADDSYWAGILKAKTDLELQLNGIRNDLKTVQITNEQLTREKNALDLDVKNLSREKEDLKRQLDYNQKLMDSIAQEVVRERNDKFKIQEMLQPIKNENAILRRQLRSLITRKINLERKVQKLQEDNTSLERRFNEMEAMVKDKVDKISELKKQVDSSAQPVGAAKPTMAQSGDGSVELPPIVVRPQAEAVADEPMTYSGRIIGINKENNFVIMDMGEEHGIKIGDTFQVYREHDSKAVATIEVIQVRQSISACDIKRQIMPIKVGDKIR